MCYFSTNISVFGEYIPISFWKYTFFIVNPSDEYRFELHIAGAVWANLILFKSFRTIQVIVKYLKVVKTNVQIEELFAQNKKLVRTCKKEKLKIIGTRLCLNRMKVKALM